MRLVIQRVKRASVTADGVLTGEIGHGFAVLVGVTHGDTREDARYLAEKTAHLRVFEDDQGKMNRSLLDVGGAVLSVSQFTLYGDCRKGRRPSFVAAARPEEAERIYEAYNEFLRELGVAVATGKFGAMMDVDLVNWGPVTLIVDSKG
jgi:D-tyrosyl-tRNA(Tyr) deacylase